LPSGTTLTWIPSLAAALASYNADDVEIGRIILYIAGRTP